MTPGFSFLVYISHTCQPPHTSSPLLTGCLQHHSAYMHSSQGWDIRVRSGEGKTPVSWIYVNPDILLYLKLLCYSVKRKRGKSHTSVPLTGQVWVARGSTFILHMPSCCTDIIIGICWSVETDLMVKNSESKKERVGILSVKLQILGYHVWFHNTMSHASWFDNVVRRNKSGAGLPTFVSLCVILAKFQDFSKPPCP